MLPSDRAHASICYAPASVWIGPALEVLLSGMQQQQQAATGKGTGAAKARNRQQPHNILNEPFQKLVKLVAPVELVAPGKAFTAVLNAAWSAKHCSQLRPFCRVQGWQDNSVVGRSCVCMVMQWSHDVGPMGSRCAL